MLVACALACDRHAKAPASSTSPASPRYYIVGRDGTQTLGRDARRLLPGFGVVVAQQRMVGGEMVGRTSLGRDVAMKDLRPATPSRFSGVHPGDRGLDFGWVVKEGAPVYGEPDTAAKPWRAEPAMPA